MIKKNNVIVFISASIFISAATMTVLYTRLADNKTGQEELFLEQFRALPYLSYTEEKADEAKKGVTVYNKEKASDGYSLGNAHLMDMEGSSIKRISPYIVVILDNGHLLKENPIGLGKYTWDMVPIWERKDLRIHHELILTEDNTILTATMEVHEYNGRMVEFDVIVELDLDGNEVSRWLMRENLEKIKQFHKPVPLDKPAVDVQKDKTHIDGTSPFGGDYNYHHLNSIQSLPQNPLEEDKGFRRGNWLISLANFSLVLILDKDTKEVLWNFGPGEIEAQHMPRMLDNGNILIFDNGRKRRYTRIIELDPVAKEIVWEYKADPPESFFCRTLGSIQRLPNGNTLIGDSESGRAFEVTREGETVWEWFNPVFDKEGRRKTFYRITRYPKEKIDKILKMSYKENRKDI
ncbi:MAG: arylsulfotransferase family protein [Candidatus Omnitrophota bacterium]